MIDSPTSWQDVPLGSLCESVSVGYVSSTRAFFTAPGDGVRLVRSQNIRPGRLLLSDTAWVNREFHEKNRKSQLRPDDILITRVGANAGDVCAVPHSAPELHLSSAVYARPKPQYARYLEYFLRSPLGQYRLKSQIVGSVSERINTRDVESLPTPLPPEPQLHALTHALSALDDKIELNRRMNETLEATARAVFKSWFVDFDPVRAKLDGRQPHGMTAETAALFPDRFEHVNGELVPAGWRLTTIGEAVEVRGGATPSTKKPEFWEGGVHSWATPKDLSGLQGPILRSTGRQITDAGVSAISSGLLPIGTVLLSSRAPVGYVAMTVMPCAINQGFIAMTPPEGMPSSFVYFWTLTSMDAILNRASGTTFAEISKRNFRPIRIVLPPDGLLDAFGRVADPLFQLIASNGEESRTLAEVRDTLLPKLLSGELSVPAAEDVVEEVA